MWPADSSLITSLPSWQIGRSCFSFFRGRASSKVYRLHSRWKPSRQAWLTYYVPDNITYKACLEAMKFTCVFTVINVKNVENRDHTGPVTPPLQTNMSSPVRLVMRAECGHWCGGATLTFCSWLSFDVLRKGAVLRLALRPAGFRRSGGMES